MQRNTLTALALALAAAAPLAAQAQSNVTIYGLIDINLSTEHSGDQRFQGLAHSELNGTRWGLKGSEDLGNGLKAIFTLESGFNPGTGTSEQGGRLFGRQSFVGLEGNWGRFTLGRQYSPAYVAIDPFDSTGSSDRSAGLLSRKTGGVKPAYEPRFDNMVKFRSADYSGFSVDTGYWFGEKPENAAGDASQRREGDGYGITGLYSNGPLSASLTTQTVFRDKTSGKVRTNGLGLSWDFGPAKAFLAYTQDRELGSQGEGKARTYDVGVAIKAGSQGTVAVSYANRNESNDPAAEDAHGWSLYYMHDLSKRTTLYTGYSQLSNKDDANYSIGNLTPVAGDDHRVIMAGIRHKF
ncbi:MAG TPA: porin [Aromatoleum sp.]|uniref:porin n=1 Tax=Aromatoleum sp. TaxID=2307007 RepID=UPI002B48873E|nr:porin [Aromatoleum sp.]HJV26580.1 porin [Aromatoleum sp.]